MPKNGYMLNPSCEINNYSFRHPSMTDGAGKGHIDCGRAMVGPEGLCTRFVPRKFGLFLLCFIAFEEDVDIWYIYVYHSVYISLCWCQEKDNISLALYLEDAQLPRTMCPSKVRKTGTWRISSVLLGASHNGSKTNYRLGWPTSTPMTS